MEEWNENAPGGMTDEQREKFGNMDSFDAAIAYKKRCQEENLTDEYKEYRAMQIKNGTFGGIGGAFPKYYLEKENGKLVCKENKIEDY